MRFALRRLGFFLLTLWIALTINFLLPRLMPGNPALAMISKFHGQLNPQALKALDILFGINTHTSLWQQYVTYLHNVFTGNFGTSMSFYPASVGSVIGGAIWWTVGLVGVATVLAFVLGTGLGILSAWRRGGGLDNVLPPVFVIASAVPYFWVAMVLVLIFGISLHWLPYIGGYNVSSDTPSLSPSYLGDVLSHALLPAAALLITTIGTWILTMRNAIMTNLTGFAMSLGFVVSGAILIEYVFNYPGVGYMLLQAVSGEDYPLMQALFLLITVAVLVAILIADIATALLDPRTRTAG